MPKKPVETQDLRLRYWQQTGKYLYEGISYSNPPHELEVDTGRGVIYVHNLISAETVLRVCRVPRDVIRVIEIDCTAIIDLVHSPSSIRNVEGRMIHKKPVFIIPSGKEAMLDMKAPPDGSFKIINIKGQSYYEFTSVPGQLIFDIWVGKFVDITLGYTGIKQP
jgi:hypothetical protein